MADKWIPRKAVVSDGDSQFQTGANIQKDSTIQEKDMLDAPLHKESDSTFNQQPIRGGQTQKHYNGGTVDLPKSSEMGQSR